ncbi:MAG: thioredoxin family protein, partial [Flavobacteriales bacterium]
PKSAGAVFFKLEKKRKEIPAYFSRRAAYQKVFWKGMDLDNQQLQYLPNSYRTLKIYTELQEINDSLYSFAMNNLLSKIKTSSNFEFFSTWFFKNMRYNQKYSIDKTFVNTYRKYFDTLKIEYENISNFRAIERSYDDVNTNMQGEVITDFKLHTKSDSLVILSRVYPKNDYTFIAFYDPDCFHCQKAMPKLSALFSDLKKNKNIKIATIGMLNAYDQMGWSTFITRNNMQNWINLYSKDPNKAYQDDYNSYSNPRFFLLDSKGILLSRSGDVNELYKIINLK